MNEEVFQKEKTLVNSKMATGTECYRTQVPYHLFIEGSINGTAFTVEGKGFGDSHKGVIRGKYVCTSGKLPMAWAALASTFQYGYKCYSNFPNGLPNMYQEAMPQGFDQDRVAVYDDDGTVTTHHDIYMQDGVVINKIKLVGEGFRSDSPVLNDNLKVFLPLETTVFPCKNGLKTLSYYVYPLKNSSDYACATVTETNFPLGKGRNVPVPGPHYVRVQIQQTRDNDDESDHVIQEEHIEAHFVTMFD